MMKKMFVFFNICVFIISTCLFPVCANTAGGDSDNLVTASIPFATYLQSKTYQTDEMYRRDSNTVGSLVCEGATYSGKQFDGVPRYIADSSHINLSFFYSTATVNKPYKDYQTIVNYYNLGASVQTGAITIFTKTDKDEEYSPLFAACDIFKTHRNGIKSLYCPDTNDLLDGIYVKVMVAFAFCHGGENMVKRQLQVAEFFLISSIDPLIFDLAHEERANTLSNGGCTMSGFEIAQTRTTSLSISYNGSAYVHTDKTVFREPGCYDLRFQTLEGKKTHKRIFILPAKEEVFQYYFPSGLLSETTRFFSTSNYPTYEMAAFIEWSEPDDLPPLSGKLINNLNPKESFEIPIEKGYLAVPEGCWTVAFQGGQEGSFYNFEQTFEVINTTSNVTVNEYFINQWQVEHRWRDWRPVEVLFQCDQMVAIDVNGNITELTFGQQLGDQLAPGRYTIRENCSTSGKIYAYTLELEDNLGIGMKDKSIICVLIALLLVSGILLVMYIVTRRRNQKC